MFAACIAQIAHVHRQPAVAVDAATLQPSVLEKVQQTLIVLATKTRRLGLPGVVAAGMNGHGIANACARCARVHSAL